MASRTLKPSDEEARFFENLRKQNLGEKEVEGTPPKTSEDVEDAN